MKTSLILVLSLVLLCASSVSAQQQSETEKAIELYRNGDFGSAMNILKAVVEADKKDRKAWVYLGGCYVRSQNEKLAREAFKKAESLVPKKYSPEDNTKFNDALKITSKPRVPYVDKARAEGIQGTVKFAVEFGADGKIKFIFPVQTLMFAHAVTFGENRFVVFNDGNRHSRLILIFQNPLGVSIDLRQFHVRILRENKNGKND